MININGKIHLSINQAAAYLGVPAPTVRSWLSRYPLPRIRVADRIMIAQDDLTSFVANKPLRGRPRKKKKQKAASNEVNHE